MKNKNSILYTGNRIGCINPQPLTKKRTYKKIKEHQ